MGTLLDLHGCVPELLPVDEGVQFLPELIRTLISRQTKEAWGLGRRVKESVAGFWKWVQRGKTYSRDWDHPDDAALVRAAHAMMAAHPDLDSWPEYEVQYWHSYRELLCPEWHDYPIDECLAGRWGDCSLLGQALFGERPLGMTAIQGLPLRVTSAEKAREIRDAFRSGGYRPFPEMAPFSELDDEAIGRAEALTRDAGDDEDVEHVAWTLGRLAGFYEEMAALGLGVFVVID